MMAVKLLRYSVATLLFLLAIGLISIAIVSSHIPVNQRIFLAAGAIISVIFGAGCILKPDLAKKVLLGQGFDKT